MIPRPAARADLDPFIDVRDIKYSFEGGFEALKGLNLRIRTGEFIAIVGGNGSGKTTLAKNLNGLLRPTSGYITVAGKPAEKMTVAEIARHIGYAFQNPDHQLFSSTVAEEVRFGPRNLGMTDAEVAEKSEHAIALMGIENCRDAQPLSLTLGLRRKVSIATVIAMDPQVIVLDEPTTGLDAGEIVDLMGCVQVLNNEGHTLIFITHDMRLVAKYAKRVLVMAGGKIVLDSDPTGVFHDLEILESSKLEPPPVTLLAHRLQELGIPKNIATPEQLVDQIVRASEGRR
jgi:energy-coupling factor transport system ATP-binding protein